MKLEIDITDWQEETQQSETIITNKDDIIKEINEGKSTSEVSRAVVVCRENGLAPSDIISPNKPLLNMGARADVITIIHQYKHDVELPNGQVFQINDFTGRWGRPIQEEIEEKESDPEDETDKDESIDELKPRVIPCDDGPSFVGKDNPLYVERASGYLQKVVPGHIAPRLVKIYECGGDVREAIRQLHNSLDELEARILG